MSFRSVLLAAVPWLLATGSRLPAQLDPEKSLASMKPAEDLEVTLFAAEPQLLNPTCIDVDPRGRVWVCEGVNYRGKANPPFRKTGDRIVILEDKDGDGRADKSTVFFESVDLKAPLGICYLGDRILVSQSPDIWTIEVRLDCTAGERKRFLTGFGGIDHDHGVHSMLLGPDGFLYCAFGNEGVHVTDNSGRKIYADGKPYFGGMVFRCGLDGAGSEVLAHNFRNNYECALDSFGNVWQSDNDDDGNQWVRFTYVMQGGNYGYLGPTGRHWSQEKKSHFHMEDPGVVPTLLRTGAGSPTGLCVYEGSLLPERYRGLPIHTDAGPGVVQCFRVRPMGGGWHVEGAPLDRDGRQTIETLSTIFKPEALLTSTDSFFRPSDVAVAPDGSLLVADWYDPGVGGHGMGDTSRGRIYRLTPKGHKGYRVPAFDIASEDGIRAAFASPALSVRSRATLKIMEQGAARLDLLRGLATSRDAVQRARALWLLGRLDEGRKDVEAMLRDPDPRFRVLAVRRLKTNAPGDFVRLTRPLVADPDAHVRREILVQLRDVAGGEAMASIIALASQYDGHDRWYLEAIAIACRGRESEAYQALAKSWEGKWPAAANGITWVLHPPEAAALLAGRLGDRSLKEEDRMSLVRAVAELEGTAGGEALVRLLASDAPASLKREAARVLDVNLGAKWSSLRASETLRAGAAALLRTPGMEDCAARLAGAGRILALRGEMEHLSQDGAAAEPVRIASVRALAAIDDPASVSFLKSAASDTSPAIVEEAAKALGGMSGSRPQSALREILGSTTSPELRSSVVKALGNSKSGAVLLLHMAQKGELPDGAKALATTVAHSSAFEEVRLMAEKILPRPKTGGGKDLPPVAELVKKTGDAARGRHVFYAEDKGNCGRCHRIRNKGSEVGPDLSAIGTKLGREGLLEAILSPSAAISHEYKVWILETRSAGFVTGYIVDDTPDGVTIKDANGKSLAFAKDDVAGRTPSDVSLMPEGLVGTMTAADLMDLVELLGQQKPLSGAAGKPVVLSKWMLAGPFANEGEKGFDEVYPPEKAVDLSAEYRGRDGAVRWKRIRARGDGYVDLHRELEGTDHCVVYFFTGLQSPREQEADLILGSDDGVKIWLNGSLVHSNHAHRAAEPDQDRVRVRLRQDRNDLLVKVDNGDGPAGLYFSVDAAEAVKQE